MMREVSDERSASPTLPAISHGETVAAQGAALDQTRSAGASMHTTVLPRIADVDGQPRWVHEARPRYAPVSRLGAGGMGEVTLVHDQDIGRKVALKRLLEPNQAMLARFTDEVRIVGRLEHPNIVPIHDVGVDEQGQHFFVMKYVDGETLEKIIERLAAKDPAYEARFTHAARLQISIELLRAVQHAHENGIIHRDLKPANIMVGRYGEVMLMDWGLAKFVGNTETLDMSADTIVTPREPRANTTQAGSLLGTPAYMSPEQAAGRHDELDERSDLYSVSIVLYELFALKHPRGKLSTFEHVHAATERPISRGDIFKDFSAAGAPVSIVHILKVALEQSPEARFPTASALAARLATVRDDAAPIQCHITFLTRLTSAMIRGANRHPWIALVVLLALPAVVVLEAVRLLRLL
jgi:serine/threonine-protein kinase